MSKNRTMMRSHRPPDWGEFIVVDMLDWLRERALPALTLPKEAPAPTVYPVYILFYITGGAVIPIIFKVRISARRTTATVASKNCFRFSSGSLSMG